MRFLSCLLALAALLLSAPLAQAYAIYNHLDKEVCMQGRISDVAGTCDYKIKAHGHHSGEHGSGYKHVWAIWVHGKACRCSHNFDIPDGGYARIYDTEVKVYKHSGKHIHTIGLHSCACPPAW